MPEKSNQAPGERPEMNRRESDRTGHRGGVQAGGRRESDRNHTLPRSNVARFTILASFLFSTGLVAWAFTLPFRSGSLAGRGNGRASADATLTGLEYEARLSDEEYVNYTRDIDRRFLARVQDKNRPQTPGQTKDELHQEWQQRVEKRKAQLRQMVKASGEKVPREGTIEWQTWKDLEKIISDAPSAK
ncbi:hypothetical protein Enr13x_64540 [Stieleria neptunia]|uniref:Transmembrane protein n=1 Tax=Stieleria neptunia TaxID=2527979 RepID=A0A518I0B2_9BACT|nr:hypothetical protein [Stieleria neptunia]QDV46545.1 hypothetical protein Enr13x_64540 [Stieleria neptunia]